MWTCFDISILPFHQASWYSMQLVSAFYSFSASFKWISNNIYHAEKKDTKRKSKERKKTNLNFHWDRETLFNLFSKFNLFKTFLFSSPLLNVGGEKSRTWTAYTMQWVKNVYEHCQKCSTAIFHNFFIVMNDAVITIGSKLKEQHRKIGLGDVLWNVYLFHACFKQVNSRLEFYHFNSFLITFSLENICSVLTFIPGLGEALSYIQTYTQPTT